VNIEKDMTIKNVGKSHATIDVIISIQLSEDMPSKIKLNDLTITNDLDKLVNYIHKVVTNKDKKKSPLKT